MKRFGFVVVAITALFFAGCKHIEGNGEENFAKTSNTYAVVVGMEYSRFAGSCPGAGLDAERMKELIGKYSASVVYLRDSIATKSSVVSALQDAIEKAGEDGLVIFYYSGHGGSEPFPDTGIEEVDGNDEFLCLWDTYLRDNDIWKIISKSRGRVFFMSDSCHSQTQFKSPSIRLSPPLAWDHTVDGEGGFSLLCWSGCPDENYSYGSSSGGQFTNALLRHFADNKTYEELWNEIKKDKQLRIYENPQSTILGNGFKDRLVFR